MTSNKSRIDAVRAALSPARLATYEVAAGVQGDGDLAALELYAWNAEISSALLVPLHVCEVVIRNTVANALEPVYGARWPWSTTFERRLPDPQQGYSPRRDLQSARRSSSSTGKVIPELKFVFWQKMPGANRYARNNWWKKVLSVPSALKMPMPMHEHGKPVVMRPYPILNALRHKCVSLRQGWIALSSRRLFLA